MAYQDIMLPTMSSRRKVNKYQPGVVDESRANREQNSRPEDGVFRGHGILNENCGIFTGMSSADAQEDFLAILETKGLGETDVNFKYKIGSLSDKDTGGGHSEGSQERLWDCAYKKGRFARGITRY